MAPASWHNRGGCQEALSSTCSVSHAVVFVLRRREAEDAVVVMRGPVLPPEQKTSAERQISAQGGMGQRPSSDSTGRQREPVVTLRGTQLQAQPHHAEGKVSGDPRGAFQEHIEGKGLILSSSSVGWFDGRAGGRSTASESESFLPEWAAVSYLVLRGGSCPGAGARVSGASDTGDPACAGPGTAFHPLTQVAQGT